ncbi:hypothetical protein [Actinomadura rudentiformis]|uniref:Uncharacterized protein n=1 Tax=Actinomadura rudentiformis TaxID=359158 RepID=A0A6H9Z237_9ACTN|nr:hypothetical protein [Actinomadura rudentiformis]KAB2347327.1 hypothetical protein F8566_20155 [Actinomadura rudentiformis]
MCGIALSQVRVRHASEAVHLAAELLDFGPLDSGSKAAYVGLNDDHDLARIIEDGGEFLGPCALQHAHRTHRMLRMTGLAAFVAAQL